jgi:CubicO group peptidase (beta-lactamase class C family)
MREDAIFDLASLTKVVATTIAIMQLVETGRLRLDDNVAMFWPSFAAHGKGTITIRQLLTHTSGLRPDIRESAIWSGVRGAYAAIEADQPICPPGTQFIYSDINFIVLGALVEKISGGTLDVYASRHIFAPLRMTDTGFRLAAWHLSRVVPTDIQRGALRWGEVQDPTAYRMGGVAGQAGLFSTADDLALFAEMLLHGGTWRGTRILRPETVALMITATDLPDGSRRGLGWDIASPYATGLGTEFGPNSFGHTGYTGTALWIDPATDSFVIILTSRLHPYGRGEAQDLRRRVAHVVAGSFQPAQY